MPEFLNFSNYSWSTIHNSNQQSIDMKISDLIGFTEICGLKSYNKIVNSMGRTLDLVIGTEETVCVERDESPFHNGNRHHPALRINILLHESRTKTGRYTNRNSLPVRNYKRADFLLMYSLFRDIDWKPLYETRDSNEAASYFDRQLQRILDETVPLQMRGDSLYPRWFTKEIICLIKEKEKNRIKYKRTKHNHFKQNFQNARKQLKSKMRAARYQFEAELERKIKSEPRGFWSYIK